MARLFLDPGQTYASIGQFGTTEVFGTNEAEIVYVEQIGKANFDPSFNRGGDEIIIDGASASYSGTRVGSAIIISSSGEFGASIRIPVGTAGSTVTFSDGSFELLVVDNVIQLGDQDITATAAVLNGLGEGLPDSSPPPAEAAFDSGVDFAAGATAYLTLG